MTSQLLFVLKDTTSSLYKKLLGKVLVVETALA